MEKTVEKVKLNLTTWKSLKKLLNASDEDFELACESIKGMDISSVAICVLAKYLMYGRRIEFKKKFQPSLTLVGVDENIDMSWKSMLPLFSESPYLTDIDKVIIQQEIEGLVSETLKTLDYDFIKKVKLELKW